MAAHLDIWWKGRKLFYAVRYGSMKDVQDFLQETTLVWRDSSGNSVVHEAARGNHLKVLQTLIAAGAEVDSVNDEGETPLILAARKKNLEVVKTLIEHGANPFHQDKTSRTARGWAVSISQILVPFWKRIEWDKLNDYLESFENLDRL